MSEDHILARFPWNILGLFRAKGIWAPFLEMKEEKPLAIQVDLHTLQRQYILLTPYNEINVIVRPKSKISLQEVKAHEGTVDRHLSFTSSISLVSCLKDKDK